MIGDVRHVAVGNASPIPATAALLCRARGGGRPYVSLLQSRKHNFFTDGGRELFDCAGQGRIDVFFLSGGEIDGEGNINLVSIGEHDHPKVRFPGSFGSALSLLGGAESHPVPHRAFAPHAGAAGSVRQRAGREPRQCLSAGGPIALVTNRCVFGSTGRGGGSVSTACIRATRSTRSSSTQGSISTGRAWCRRRRRRRPKRCG